MTQIDIDDIGFPVKAPLHHRVDYFSDFSGEHTAQHTETDVDEVFYNTASLGIGLIEGQANQLFPTPIHNEWVGDVGWNVNKPGMHSLGRAMDLTAIKMNNGLIDMNGPWFDGNQTRTRRYIGVLGGMRYWCHVSIGRWRDSAHVNHIHSDNEIVSSRIRTDSNIDVSFVQAACVHLNGANIDLESRQIPNGIGGWAHDGVWDAETQSAYEDLLDSFDMKCLDPKTNDGHAGRFWFLILQTGITGSSAGAYTYGAC